MDTLANVKTRVSQSAWAMVTDAPLDTAMAEGLFDSVFQELLDEHQWRQWRKVVESVAVNIDEPDTASYLHVLPSDVQYVVSVLDENCCRVHDYRMTSDGIVTCSDTVTVEYLPTNVCGVPKLAEVHLLWALVGRLVFTLTVNAQGQATTDEFAGFLKEEFMFVDSSNTNGYDVQSKDSKLRSANPTFGYHLNRANTLGRAFRRY